MFLLLKLLAINRNQVTYYCASFSIVSCVVCLGPVVDRVMDAFST